MKSLRIAWPERIGLSVWLLASLAMLAVSALDHAGLREAVPGSAVFGLEIGGPLWLLLRLGVFISAGFMPQRRQLLSR